MDLNFAKWESFLAKVEAEFDGIVFDLNEMQIVWEVFHKGGAVQWAVERIADYAAQLVINHFSRDPEDREDYEDGMDGDHDSAMASCGWGTDEDYGYYGD